MFVSHHPPPNPIERGRSHWVPFVRFFNGAFKKPFEAPQSVKIKIQVNFFFSSAIGTRSVNIVTWEILLIGRKCFLKWIIGQVIEIDSTRKKS